MVNTGVAFVGAGGVVRLDAAASSTSTSFSYTISAGSSRCLCVAVGQEGSDPISNPTASWGGQSMTLLSSPDAGSPDAVEVTTFWLSESGIAAGSGTTISIGSVTNPRGVSVASYAGCSQSTPTNKDTGSSATSSPVTSVDIVTTNPGSLVFAAAVSGLSSTASWGADLTEQTDVNPTDMGHSMADALVPDASNNIDCNCTWSSQNRAVTAAFEVEKI